MSSLLNASASLTIAEKTILTAPSDAQAVVYTIIISNLSSAQSKKKITIKVVDDSAAVTRIIANDVEYDYGSSYIVDMKIFLDQNDSIICSSDTDDEADIFISYFLDN